MCVLFLTISENNDCHEIGGKILQHKSYIFRRVSYWAIISQVELVQLFFNHCIFFCSFERQDVSCIDVLNIRIYKYKKGEEIPLENCVNKLFQLHKWTQGSCTMSHEVKVKWNISYGSMSFIKALNFITDIKISFKNLDLGYCVTYNDETWCIFFFMKFWQCCRCLKIKFNHRLNLHVDTADNAGMYL